MKNRAILYLFIFIIAGGLIGTLLSDLGSSIFPRGVIREFFTRKIGFGLNPPLNLTLSFFSLTFGFNFYLTVLAILGIIIGVLLYRKLS